MRSTSECWRLSPRRGASPAMAARTPSGAGSGADEQLPRTAHQSDVPSMTMAAAIAALPIANPAAPAIRSDAVTTPSAATPSAAAASFVRVTNAASNPLHTSDDPSGDVTSEAGCRASAPARRPSRPPAGIRSFEGPVRHLERLRGGQSAPAQRA